MAVTLESYCMQVRGRNYSRKLMISDDPHSLLTSTHSITCPAPLATSPTSKNRFTIFFFVSTHLVFVVATCMSLGVSSLSAAAGAKMLSSGSPEIAHLTFRAFAMSSLTT